MQGCGAVVVLDGAVGALDQELFCEGLGARLDGQVQRRFSCVVAAVDEAFRGVR